MTGSWIETRYTNVSYVATWLSLISCMPHQNQYLFVFTSQRWKWPERRGSNRLCNFGAHLLKDTLRRQTTKHADRDNNTGSKGSSVKKCEICWTLNPKSQGWLNLKGQFCWAHRGPQSTRQLGSHRTWHTRKSPPTRKKKSINQLSRGLFLFPVHQDEARDERGSWLWS